MRGQPHLIEFFAALALCAWTSVASAQVQWSRHPGNPVFAHGGSGSWDESVAAATTVMFHQGIYKMWYEGDSGFGYATSPDGLTWSRHASNPVLLPGAAGSWDEVAINNASVVYESGLYRMWYSAEAADGDNRVGYATSPDGVVWTKYASNPVLDLGPPGSMDESEVLHPRVVFEAGLYRMWYNGVGLGSQQILYASSTDGINWSRFTARPMLEPGLSPSWDDGELGPLCVVLSGAVYHMWYTGWNQSGDFAIGHAMSPDGLDWTKTTAFNPVLSPGSAGSWDDALIALPNVLLEGGLFRMWYGGTDGVVFQTGLATSLDVTDVVRGPPGIANGSALCTLYQNEPNPFRASTTIRFHLAATAPVRVDIIDVAGRRVRRLLRGYKTGAGLHVLQWDGRDDKGRQLGTGLYFCRLMAPGEVLSQRMILAR